MKRWLTLVVMGVMLAGVAWPSSAEAGDKRKKWKHRHAVGHYGPYSDGYFRGRDVYVIREYYRPYYRPLPPGLQRRLHRTGHLPPGWAKRMRPIPVYIERDLIPVPRGYRRGIINGHAVIYNDRGFILDMAILF